MNKDKQMPDQNNEILVVDDTVANLKLLLDMLIEKGYKVRPANNGEQALASVAIRKPELILLDIKMPGMDGYEVCRRLKEDEETRDIPVVFISALDDLAARIKGFEVGGVDYISKPFQQEEVLMRVETHMQLHKMQENLEQLVEERTLALQQANEKLKKSEAKFRRIVEGLRLEYFFYSHGVDGVFTYLSPSIKQVLGYTQEEFLVHFNEYLTDNPINEKVKYHNEQVISGKEQATYEIEIYRKDRSVCNLEVKESPVFDDNGNVIAIVGLAHDISARRAVKT